MKTRYLMYKKYPFFIISKCFLSYFHPPYLFLFSYPPFWHHRIRITRNALRNKQQVTLCGLTGLFSIPVLPDAFHTKMYTL